MLWRETTMKVNEILAKTIEKIDGAYAPTTIRAYKANFERFIQFCEGLQAIALPADTNNIARYIVHLTKIGLKSASIRIAIAAISSIHKLNQLDDPTQHPNVKIELRRMHRTIGRASKQAFGITASNLEKMISATGRDSRGLRDKALLLLAYDSLCRRSELVSLRLNDIEYNNSGLPFRIKLRRSKTDQEAIGKVIRLSPKAQEAVQAWIEITRIEDGFLFRGIKNNGDISQGINPGQINRIYKRLAQKAGLPKEIIKNISGHSFRVGGAQDLLASGASLPMLMNRGGWTKPETVMRYIEYS